MNKDANVVGGIASGFAAVLIWAGFPVITELAFTQSRLSVSDLTAIRFVVSALILLPFVLRIPADFYRKISASGKQLFLFLLFVSGSGAPYILVVSYGIAKSEASHFGIVVPSSMLIFTAFGAALWLTEPLRRHSIIGGLIILAGIAIIAQASLTQFRGDYWLGDLLLLLGGLLWSGFTQLSRYYGLHPLQSIGLVSVCSALMFLPYYFIFETSHIFQAHWQAVALQVVYQGVLLSVVALVLYAVSIANLGAAKGALFAACLPGLTLILTSLLPNQHITASELGGAIVVSLGMLVSLNLRFALKSSV